MATRLHMVKPLAKWIEVTLHDSGDNAEDRIAAELKEKEIGFGTIHPIGGKMFEFTLKLSEAELENKLESLGWVDFRPGRSDSASDQVKS